MLAITAVTQLDRAFSCFTAGNCKGTHKPPCSVCMWLSPAIDQTDTQTCSSFFHWGFSEPKSTDVKNQKRRIVMVSLYYMIYKVEPK